MGIGWDIALLPLHAVSFMVFFARLADKGQSDEVSTLVSPNKIIKIINGFLRALYVIFAILLAAGSITSAIALQYKAPGTIYKLI
jgi:hypothetical protein